MLRALGRLVILFLQETGALALLLFRAIKGFPRLLTRADPLFEQMESVGVRSLPLVVVTSLFTGAVSSVQAAYQLKGYVTLRYLGAAVGKAIFIELGPVLTALVVAGRVGASIAAELGTMRTTEQIDALESLAIDPIPYLVTPRFYSLLVMLPVLTIFADLVAIMGGFLVALFLKGVGHYTFLEGLRGFFQLRDLSTGLLKSFCFGGIIALIGCWQGLGTYGGAGGVGRSTTKAVVVSAVLILFWDFFIASIVF